MSDNKKSYFAIIPASVRYDKNIIPNAKLLYGEITALCNEKGYCWATNQYFSELYQVSKQTISKWINQLKENNYINVEMEYKKGSKEILNRYIRLFEYPINEKRNTPINEKAKDNITLSNNTINKYIYILEKWNSKKIQVHNEQTFKTNLKDKHKRILKCYTQEQILKAIDNYYEIVSNDKYYFNWKFTVWDFIQKKLEYFIDEADPFNNFLDFKHKKQTKEIITDNKQKDYSEGWND